MHRLVHPGFLGHQPSFLSLCLQNQVDSNSFYSDFHQSVSLSDKICSTNANERYQSLVYWSQVVSSRLCSVTSCHQLIISKCSECKLGNWVNFGSVNGLLPDGTKSLAEPKWLTISEVPWNSSGGVVIRRFKDNSVKQDYTSHIWNCA